jgi:cold shock CspA family protein
MSSRREKRPFEALRPGEQVRFCEELGEQGPQASTVHVAGHKAP